MRHPKKSVGSLAILALTFASIPVIAHALRFDRFMRFHGIQYRADMYTYGRDPVAGDLGPEYGRVTCDIVAFYSFAPNSFEPTTESDKAMKHCLEQEGGASSMDVGTPVYTMRGYRPEYRLAARVGDRWIIFYAWENPNAKVGADMLDLEKKVARITVSLDSSARGRNQWSSKNNQNAAQVEKITRMVLAAPIVKQPVITSGASRYRYWITLWFKDGTAQGLAYFPDTGWLHPGLQMPQEFRRLVEEQLPPN
jgi:hypothetical protein